MATSCRGHALAGATPFSPAGIARPCLSDGPFLSLVAPLPWMRLLPHRKPASLFPLPHLANSCPQPGGVPPSRAGIALPSARRGQLLHGVVPLLGPFPLGIH